jgi:hypothetical protein
MTLRCADRPYRAWTDESKETLRRSRQLNPNSGVRADIPGPPLWVIFDQVIELSLRADVRFDPESDQTAPAREGLTFQPRFMRETQCCRVRERSRLTERTTAQHAPWRCLGR